MRDDDFQVQHDAVRDPSAGLFSRTIPAGFWVGWAVGNRLAAKWQTPKIKGVEANKKDMLFFLHRSKRPT